MTLVVCKKQTQEGDAGVCLYGMIQGVTAGKFYSLEPFKVLFCLKFPALKMQTVFCLQGRALTSSWHYL